MQCAYIMAGSVIEMTDRKVVMEQSTRPPGIGHVPSAPAAMRLGVDLAVLAGYAVVDKVRRRPVRTEAAVPGRVQDITTAWLNRVLRPVLGDTRVVSHTVLPHSSGISVRARIQLRYNVDSPTTPRTLFVKSASTLTTRIGNGLSGCAPAEVGFYTRLRRQVDLQAPFGFYSATEPRSHRAVHLLEDLVETRAATFCAATTPISRAQAQQMVEQLAALHAAGRDLPRSGGRTPSWLKTYPQWWQATGSISAIRRYHLRGQRQADELGITPSNLVGRGERLWSDFETGVESHRQLPMGLIHGDTHLGNWYLTGAGDMGLCDWQCISLGHWSRDLAYTLSSALPVERRREWETDLIESYLEQLAARGGAVVPRAQAIQLYRRQLTGALAMWTTTLCPPRLLPEMQPRATSEEMLRRILTAIDDHDVLGHAVAA